MPIIKKLYIYEETHLPAIGWLQGCITCGTITSHMRLFTVVNNDILKKTNEIYSYLCPKCKRKLSNVEFNIKYNLLCNKVIEEENLLPG